MDKPALDPTKAFASKTLKHTRQLTRCRFSPCGQYVVAGGLDNLLHRWELATEKKTELAGHTCWIGALAFHPDGKRLFAVDYHGALLCWPYTEAAPKPLWSVKEAHGGWARAVAVSPDGKLVVTAGDDRIVRVWSADTGKPMRELPGHKGCIFSLAFHPSGLHLVSGDLFGVVKQWECATGKWVRDLDASTLHTRKEDFLADVGGVRAIAFNADGSRMACSGLTEAESNTFCPGTPAGIVFDWASGKAQLQLRTKEKADGYINTLRYLPDGTLAGLGEGASGAALWFWKPGAAESFHALKGHSGYEIDLHPDGLRLAAVLFEPLGRGGNGRHAKPGEYIPNGAVVRIFNLHAPPPKA